MRTQAFMVLAVLPFQGPEAPEVPECAVAVRQDFSKGVELTGVFVPSEPEELSLWPEAYQADWTFTQVLAHGTYVNSGDVIAQLDARALDDQVRAAELELTSTEIAHSNQLEQARIEVEASEAKLGEARRMLELATLDRDGWQKYGLDIRRRSDDLSGQYRQHGIDDQQDELDQLEAMYRDDELVDATEEIVLKRSRRDLARTKVAQKLSGDQRSYEETYEVAKQTRLKEEQVRKLEGELDRLVRTQALEQRSRDDGVARSRESLDRKRLDLEALRTDRENMVVRAPRAGVLLHGGADDYGPGKSRPTHERGGRAALRTPLFSVADPDRLAVAVAVPESDLSAVRSGMTVEVLPTVRTETPVLGTLALERYPTAESASAAENSYGGRVTLEQAVTGIVVGMRATLELSCETLEGVVTIPAAAVFGSSADAHCWVAAADSTDATRVSLRLGPRSSGEVVVYGELDAGDRVLLSTPER